MLISDRYGSVQPDHASSFVDFDCLEVFVSALNREVRIFDSSRSKILIERRTASQLGI